MRCLLAACLLATLRQLFWPLVVFAVVVIGLILFLPHAHARDDGRWARSDLKPWFDKLASGKGLCCSFADGRSVADPDWGTEPVATADGTQVRYWVRVDGQKIVVPPDALITEPNREPRPAGSRVRVAVSGHRRQDANPMLSAGDGIMTKKTRKPKPKPTPADFPQDGD